MAWLRQLWNTGHNFSCAKNHIANEMTRMTLMLYRKRACCYSQGFNVVNTSRQRSGLCFIVIKGMGTRFGVSFLNEVRSCGLYQSGWC